MLKVFHDLPLFLAHYGGPNFDLLCSANSFSCYLSTHFLSAHYILDTLALCLSSKYSRCVISLACLSSWLSSYVGLWLVIFIINLTIYLKKRNLRVILIHGLRRNRVQYMGKGRAAGYEAARDSVPKSGIREKIQNVIGLQNLKLCRLHPITLLFLMGLHFSWFHTFQGSSTS